MVAITRNTQGRGPSRAGVAARLYRVVPEDESVAALAPELVSLCWDPFLNGGAVPTEIAPNSVYLAWWRCPGYEVCGKVALVSVRNKFASHRRAGRVRDCRQCAARKRSLTQATLADYVPQAAEALVRSPENRLGADEISRWFPRTLLWRCLGDPNHPPYHATIPRTGRRLPTCPRATASKFAIR